MGSPEREGARSMIGIVKRDLSKCSPLSTAKKLEVLVLVEALVVPHPARFTLLRIIML
jgi:hypothetical protein